MRILLTLTLALPLLAFAAPAAASPREQRDQAVALQVTTDWMASYPAGLWIAVELPRPCRALPSGRRTCPIAIRLLAWTDGVLAPWRCAAHAVLPARSKARARRTSADCEPAVDAEAPKPRTASERPAGAALLTAVVRRPGARASRVADVQWSSA